jgi:sulfide:quinone oxidoreductase
VAALEAMLALHDLAEERVDVTLLCPESEFRYRPAAVAVPFGRGQVHRYPLSDVTAAAGAHQQHGVLVEVDTAAHRVVTDRNEALTYDVLVIACGARRLPALNGALAFRGEEDIAAIQDLLELISAGAVKRVVFALPRGASWALPLYELALLTADYIARNRLSAVSLHLVTPEERPLAAASSTEPLWSPGGKIAAHYLGPYLAHAPHLTHDHVFGSCRWSCLGG